MAFYEIGAMMTRQDTGIAHGPYPRCTIPGCPEAAYHLHGKACAAHAFAPRLSGGPRPVHGPRCGFPGCTAPEGAEGYCATHRAWLRHLAS